MGGEMGWASLDPVAIDLYDLVGRRPVLFDLGPTGRRLAGRRILVTGAGGSIGSALSRLLLTFQPAELVLIDHHEFSLFALRPTLGSEGRTAVHTVLGDVRDRAKVARIFRRCQPDVVFHLAAYKHVPLGEENPDEVIAVNLLGTLNVLEESAAVGAERLVFPSTDKAVDPPSVYGATKRTLELLLAASGRSLARPRAVVVRLVNTVGAQGGVIRVFAEQIAAGQPITITDRHMTRYWIGMAEATGLLALAAALDRPTGILLLDVGEPVELMAIARRLWELVGSLDRPLVVRDVGMRAGERLHEYLVGPGEALRPTSQPGLCEVVADDAGYPSFERLASDIRALGAQLSRRDPGDLRDAVFALTRVPVTSDE